MVWISSLGNFELLRMEPKLKYMAPCSAPSKNVFNASGNGFAGFIWAPPTGIIPKKIEKPYQKFPLLMVLPKCEMNQLKIETSFFYLALMAAAVLLHGVNLRMSMKHYRWALPEVAMEPNEQNFSLQISLRLEDSTDSVWTNHKCQQPC